MTDKILRMKVVVGSQMPAMLIGNPIGIATIHSSNLKCVFVA